jgi:hypothetical protein
MRSLVIAATLAVIGPAAAMAAPPDAASAATLVAQASPPAAPKAAPAEPAKPAEAGKKAAEPGKPAAMEASVVSVRGTVEAIDKEKQTVTLKGPKRSIVLQVRDPKKLDAIAVGDPVVGKYYESIAFAVKKSGEGAPGASAQQTTATSKPGETPAGAVAQQITVTATITAIDKNAKTVTIKGPEGNAETVKARDPKNLDRVKVGDLVDITYTRAFAVSLDKRPVKTN